MTLEERSCIDCQVQACATGKGSFPNFCPTEALSVEAVEASAERYEQDPFAIKVMQVASAVSVDAFAKRWCRVEESLAFFKHMGWKRIGIASCAGLKEEAGIFAKILRAKGFEPYGVCCKVASIPKSRFDAPENCCDFGAVSCNPIMQAQLLEEADTEVNVVIGLCVGHDMLFSAYSAAPVTTLVVKDRALFHNSVGGLYAARGSSFYGSLLKEERDRECCK